MLPSSDTHAGEVGTLLILGVKKSLHRQTFLLFTL